MVSGLVLFGFVHAWVGGSQVNESCETIVAGNCPSVTHLEGLPAALPN